jgi:hypothetical protein
MWLFASMQGSEPHPDNPVSLGLDFAIRAGGKFVVSWAGEAYDAQKRSLIPKFQLRILGGDL